MSKAVLEFLVEPTLFSVLIKGLIVIMAYEKHYKLKDCRCDMASKVCEEKSVLDGFVGSGNY